MSRLILFLFAVLLLSLVTLSSIVTRFNLDTDLQMLLFITGVICLGYCWGNIRKRALDEREPMSRPYMALIIVLLLAFALRIVDLDTAIQRHVDEMNSVHAVADLWAVPDRPLLKPNPGIAAFPPVFNVLQSWTVGMVGADLNALRLPSVVFGLLTIAAVYLLALQIFPANKEDRWIPLYAALFLAVFPAHIHFSRIGINNIADPLFGTLALAFLLRGIRRNDEARSLALAGICLGLTQYFYEGGRLFFPVLLICTAFITVLRSRRGWLIFLGTAALTAAPVYFTLIFGEFSSAPRLEQTGRGMAYWRELFAEGPLHALRTYLQDDLLPTLGFYFVKRDASWFYGELLIPPAFIPAFLTGFTLLIWRLRFNSGARIILLWLFGVAAGNSLLGAKNDIPRYVLAFPAIAITTAYGFDRLIRWLYRIPAFLGVSTPRFSLLPALATIGLFAWIIWLQVDFYFGSFVDDFMISAVDVAIIDDIRFRAATLPDNTQVQIITDISFFDVDSDAYLRYRKRNEDGLFISSYFYLLLDAEYVRHLRPGRHQALFVAPWDMRSRKIVEDEPTLYGPYRSPYTRPPTSRYLMYTTWDYERGR